MKVLLALGLVGIVSILGFGTKLAGEIEPQKSQPFFQPSVLKYECQELACFQKSVAYGWWMSKHSKKEKEAFTWTETRLHGFESANQKLKVRMSSVGDPRLGSPKVEFGNIILFSSYDHGPVRIRRSSHDLPPSPVITELGGKPKWLPLDFGYHDVMHTGPMYKKHGHGAHQVRLCSLSHVPESVHCMLHNEDPWEEDVDGRERLNRIAWGDQPREYYLKFL